MLELWLCVGSPVWFIQDAMPMTLVGIRLKKSLAWCGQVEMIPEKSSGLKDRPLTTNVGTS
jgi:hypothetical protein